MFNVHPVFFRNEGISWTLHFEPNPYQTLSQLTSKTDPSYVSTENLYPSSKLLCMVCKDSFSNPWDLLVHAQAAHMVNIYEIGESDEEDEASTNSKSNKLDKTNGESHNNVNGSSCNGTAMHSNENVSWSDSFLLLC